MNFLPILLVTSGIYVVSLAVTAIVWGFVYMNIGCHYDDPTYQEVSTGVYLPRGENFLGTWLKRHRWKIICIGASILTSIVTICIFFFWKS